MTQTSHPEQPRKVLIVEDEAVEAFLLSNCFSIEGYQVCELAARGSDALRISSEQEPDIIIMDNGLSGDLTGLETAYRIRQFTTTPILFLTGYLSAELKNQIGLLEPADYLVKPVRVTEVLAHVNRLLNQNQDV